MIRNIVLIGGSIALALLAWQQSASALAGKFSPAQALRFDPTLASALVNVTESAAIKKDKSQFLSIAQRNARLALTSDPLSAVAIRQLGQHHLWSGDREQGRRFFVLSASLSRRDAATQLWLFEDRVKANQLDLAMRSLDAVLRTQPEVRGQIFQVLGATLADTRFRKTFIRYASARPAWLEEFLAFSIGTAAQPKVFAQTLVEIKPFPKDLMTDEQLGQVMTELVNKSPIEDARAFYVRLPDADRRLLTAPDIGKPGAALKYPPMGWQLFSDGNGQGFGNADGNKLTIEGVAFPGRRGTIARKLLYLEPGTYQWSGKADLSGMRDRATASIRLTCNTGPGTWSQGSLFPLSEGSNSWQVRVGTDCKAQMLLIETLGSESQNEAMLTLSEMKIRRVSPAVAASTVLQKSGA